MYTEVRTFLLIYHQTVSKQGALNVGDCYVLKENTKHYKIYTENLEFKCSCEYGMLTTMYTEVKIKLAKSKITTLSSPLMFLTEYLN